MTLETTQESMQTVVQPHSEILEQRSIKDDPNAENNPHPCAFFSK